MKLGVEFEADSEFCTGGGLGAIVLGCKTAVGGDNDTEGKSYQDINSTSADSTKTITNSFSTTWSYTTSDSPDIAGEESDVFVGKCFFSTNILFYFMILSCDFYFRMSLVPNLNVFFIEVFVVKWNTESCTPNLDGDSFPSTTIFDINAETNKPAFAFYSRHHITTTKMPEIENAIDGELDKVIAIRASIEDSETMVCCDKGDLKGFCLPTEGTLRLCTQDDLDQAIFNAGELIESLVHWQSILNNADVTKAKAINDKSYGNILNWFEKQERYQYIESTDFTEQEKNHVRMEKAITGYSQLAPESLTDIMNPISDRSNPAMDPLTSNQESKEANRIQFSGNSGSYTLKLDRSSSSEMTSMTCLDGDIMKAMAIWQKVVKFDPVTYARNEAQKQLETTLGIQPISQFGVQAFRGRIKKYLNRQKDDDFQKELKEEVKKQDEKRVDRMEAIKRNDDEKAKKAEDLKKETERIQQEIDEETNGKKKFELVLKKKEAQIAEEKAQKELEEEREKKKREKLAKKLADEEQKEKEKNKLSSAEKEKLQDQIDNETDPQKKKALAKKQLEDSLNTPRSDEDARTQKEATRQKRNEERSNKELKDRTQDKVAEDTGKKSTWSSGSFLKNALKKFEFALTAGPMVIASMQAGCNSETKYEASPADLDLSFSVFGVGVDAYFLGGEYHICTTPPPLCSKFTKSIVS